MNEFSVRKLSEVVYGDEGVVSKYRMLRPHSGTDRPIPVIRLIRETHGLGNLIGYAEPAERNSIGNQFLLLFAGF